MVAVSGGFSVEGKFRLWPTVKTVSTGSKLHPTRSYTATVCGREGRLSVWAISGPPPPARITTGKRGTHGIIKQATTASRPITGNMFATQPPISAVMCVGSWWLLDV